MRTSTNSAWVPLLFVSATFLGAALTFLLEPLVAKMLLPLFGGAPGVWNTCVLFFQSVVLLGYGYAHLLGSRRPWRSWMPVHVGAMLAGGLALPVAIGSAPGLLADDLPPVLGQLGLLSWAAGLPLFVVAATSPLLQRWLAGTGHELGRDPYRLYAASNLGSLLALLAFPLAVEPSWDLAVASRWWAWGYGMLGVLVVVGAVWTWRASGQAGGVAARQPGAGGGCARERWGWFVRAFVPSSLVLSVTTHLSTNVAAAPLLWVLPLALYLLTYVLAFANRREPRVEPLERWQPLVVLLLAVVLVPSGFEPPPWLLFPMHLGGLWVIARICHGALAEERPPAARLTDYYFWIALGGVAGGVFNVLLAPLWFDSVAEYSWGLVLACLLRRTTPGVATVVVTAVREFLSRDVLPAAGFGLLVWAAKPVGSALGLSHGPGTLWLTLGLPVLGCYLLLQRPVRFAFALGALFLVGGGDERGSGDTVHARRTFYGVHRVRRVGDWTYLYHGPTLHGSQRQGPNESSEPRAYYHRTGPVGSLFRVLEQTGRTPTQVGVVGAGVGTLAAYGQRGQRWTFYELDPEVIRLATDSGYFRFWNDSAASLRMVVGDARLNLARDISDRYDLLVLDAFSSDAVPAHLLTREAMQIYRSRLASGGLLAFHISNRFLELESVVEGLARDAGLTAVSWADLEVPLALQEAGKLGSHWVVLGADSASIAALCAAGGWKPLKLDRGGILWTDRFSDLLRVVRWAG